MAPSTDDDHVGAVHGGEVGDRVSRAADFAARRLERRPGDVSGELRNLALDLLLDLRLVGMDRVAAAALSREGVLDAVDDGQRSASLDGERLGMLQRMVGGLRAVGCPDHLLVHQPSPQASTPATSSVDRIPIG